jgi:hypothetical protein
MSCFFLQNKIFDFLLELEGLNILNLDDQIKVEHYFVEFRKNRLISFDDNEKRRLN